MTFHTLARALSLGLVLAGFAVVSAQARTQHVPVFDRHAVHSIGSEAVIGERLLRKVRTAGSKQIRRKKQRRGTVQAIVRGGQREVQLLPHPSGCPSRSFCGCGAALEVFGRHVRELWLARNWFKFPATSPAPGMVAVRRHHVFVIREVRAPGLVLAYDANSGGRKTRIHLRSLAGYRVVNPRGSQYATAG